MNSVINTLLEHLDDRSSVFVFPSQVAAGFWINKLIIDGHAQALEKKRFISWDRFKEEAFLLSQEYTPVNRITRILFAEGEIEAHRQTPLYSIILPVDYPESLSRFKKDLIQLLPELHALVDAVSARSWDIKTDLSTLYSRYLSFLEAHKLFEPSYLIPVLDELDKKYYIFSRELIEDYSQFEPAISSHKGVFAIESVSDDIGNYSAYEFSSQKNEFRWLFQTIRQKYESGVPLHDMAVSVPRLSDIEDYLCHSARLYEVPLSIRKGKPLSEYASNRLWSAVSECVSSGFSFSAVKNLLLNNAVPFSNKSAWHEFTGVLKRYACAGNWYSHKKPVDYIKQRLSFAGESQALKLYSDLYNAMKRISAASSFGVLKKEVQRFIRSFLDTVHWDDDKMLRPFQAGLDLLNDFSNIEARYSETTISQPFAVWLEAMTDKNYVDKERQGGLAVYPYRVAAGINPSLHFVINASDENLKVRPGKFSVLSEEQRCEILQSDVDYTEPFISAYCNSGAEVVFSFSREGYIERGLSPGYFMERGRIKQKSDEESIRKNDVIVSEELYWLKGRGSEYLSQWQEKGGRIFNKTGLQNRNTDMTVNPLADSFCGLSALLPITENGDLRVSATTLDGLRSCGFRFFFRKLLGVEWDTKEMLFSDPRIEGNMEHETLQMFFDNVVTPGGAFCSSDEYQEEMNTLIVTVFQKNPRYEMKLLPPEWNRIRESIIEYMKRFLEIEGRIFNGYIYKGGEESFEAVLSDENTSDTSKINIEGRIDHICSDAEGNIFIIDYKKRLRILKKEYRDYGDGLPKSIQIPLYILLMNENGNDIAGAAYYDIEKTKYTWVFSGNSKKAWCTEEEMSGYVSLLSQRIKKYAEELKQGDFPITQDEDECTSCKYRPLCRSRYTVRSS